MDGNTMHILYQSSDYYAPYTGVSMASLFENNKDVDQVVVYLIDCGIGPENRKKLDKLATHYTRELVWLDSTKIESFLQKVNAPKWNGSYSTYCKLFVLNFLPNEVERLLYIDSDTIIDGTLNELFSMDLKEAPCAMVLDAMYDKHKEFLCMPPTSLYYNAGVILFQVNQWRAKKCQEQILEHMKNIRSRYAVADQDIMNILFADDVCRLSIKYNFNSAFFVYGIKTMYQIYGLSQSNYYSESETECALNDAVIYHCFGGIGRRPWEKGSLNPVQNKWDHYLALTPWRGMEKIPAAENMKMKIQRFLFLHAPPKFYIKLHRVMLDRYFKSLDL